jgi:hypothetical protein
MVGVNMENHKGHFCPYANHTLPCVEGYCEGCEIWKKWKAAHRKSRVNSSRGSEKQNEDG